MAKRGGTAGSQREDSGITKIDGRDVSAFDLAAHFASLRLDTLRATWVTRISEQLLAESIDAPAIMRALVVVAERLHDVVFKQDVQAIVERAVRKSLDRFPPPRQSPIIPLERRIPPKPSIQPATPENTSETHRIESRLINVKLTPQEERALRAVETVTGCTRDELLTKRTGGDRSVAVRQPAMYILRRVLKLPSQRVATIMCVTPSTLSVMVSPSKMSDSAHDIVRRAGDLLLTDEPESAAA